MAQPKLRSTRESALPRAALCRLKAITAEQRARDAGDPAQRQDWEELAIEWHLLADLAAAEQPRQAEPHGLGHYVAGLEDAIHSVAQRG